MTYRREEVAQRTGIFEPGKGWVKDELPKREREEVQTFTCPDCARPVSIHVEPGRHAPHWRDGVQVNCIGEALYPRAAPPKRLESEREHPPQEEKQ